MFKYNESSQVCSFIQNLLRSKNVPMIPVLRDPKGLFSEEKIPEDFSYIHDGYFYLGETQKERYEFGKKYPNLTNNYIPTESYYSSELHEYLGEYLRAYRDTYKVDLMGLYNCFSNRLISKVSLPMSVRVSTNSSDEKKTTSFTTWYQFNAPNDNYKITCFPIKFNMEYRIKIYGAMNGNITLQPIFYHKGDYLRLSYIQSELSSPIVFYPEKFVYTNNLTYELNLKDIGSKISSGYIKTETDVNDKIKFKKYLMDNEKYLYLFIQVPQSQDIQISVIEEAEYFQVTNNTLFNLEDIKYNVPFSDRLLEFLTDNVITPYDPIKQNITRVQTILLSSDFKRKYYRELLNSPLYTHAEYEAESEESKQNAVVKGHYNKLKRFIHLTDDEKTDSNGKNIQIPPFNIIIASDETYYPTPGEYDDTMRVILYSIFNNIKLEGEQNIPDFTGYVDKDVENLLMKCVVSKELKQRLREI